MDAVLISEPDCDPDYRDLPNGNCGDPIAANFFFATFIMVTFLIIINMYVAIILENLEHVYDEEDDALNETHFEEFYATWALYDPDASQFLRYGTLKDFASRLNPPLGIPEATLDDISSLAIPLHPDPKNPEIEDCAHCVDVLHGLVKRHLATTLGLDAMDPSIRRRVEKHLAETMEKSFASAFPVRKRLGTAQTDTKQRTEELHAATMIQRVWRRRASAPQRAYVLQRTITTHTNPCDFGSYLEWANQSSTESEGEDGAEQERQHLLRVKEAARAFGPRASVTFSSRGSESDA